MQLLNGAPGSDDLGSKHHRKSGFKHPNYAKNQNREPAAGQRKIYVCQPSGKIRAPQGSCNRRRHAALPFLRRAKADEDIRPNHPIRTTCQRCLYPRNRLVGWPRPRRNASTWRSHFIGKLNSQMGNSDWRAVYQDERRRPGYVINNGKAPVKLQPIDTRRQPVLTSLVKARQTR